MNCSVCGGANETGATFCARCGGRLTAQPPPQQGGAFSGTVAMGGAGAHAQQAAQAAAQAAIAHAQQPQQAPQQQAPYRQAQGPQICAACGATFVNGHCDRCGGAQGISVPAPAQGIHWVQVRVAIKCTSCQKASPLNRLDTDGRFYCYGCGRDMFFDADLWKERIFGVASGLGDAYWAIAGVFPAWPPRDPSEDELSDADADDKVGCDDQVLVHLLKKCREIGRTTGGMTIEQGGMSIGSAGMRTRGCALEMSPGHPLCAQCKTPLATQFPSDGVVSTSCSRCGTHETYRAPPAAKAACNDFVAVLAPDHVEGREAARVAPQQGTAALAVVCPKCGSALQLAQGARITTCAYCKVTSVVPDHLAASGGAPPGKPDPLWLAFRAPSALRNVTIEALDLAQKEAGEKAASDAREQQSRAEAERQKQHERAAAESQAKTGKIVAAVGTIVPAAAVLAGLFFSGTFDHVLHRDKEDKKEGSHGGDTSGTSTTTTIATAKPPSTDPVAITSCKCAFGDGQSTPQVALTVLAPPTSSGRWSLDIERTSGFISEGRTVRLPQQAGAVLPPAADARAPSQMGVACDTGIFVLVADKTATAWSSVNGSWKWNATLPSPSIDALDAGVAPTQGTDYAGACNPLPVKNGAVSLTLANGRHASLSLKDGKVR